MAAAIINFESLVDEPMDNKHYPNRLFEDRSGKFDEYTGSFIVYGINHDRANKSIQDIVCDAIWDMGFDVKTDFFSKVSRLSQKMKNAPIVCELKKNHHKLGSEILDSPQDLARIKCELISSVDEVVVSKYVPPPPLMLLHFKKRINRTADIISIVTDAIKNLGIEMSDDSLKWAELVSEKYNAVVCEFANVNVARRVFNFRCFVPYINNCPIEHISYYREHNDYYYDNMLLISGLNARRKDTAELFLEVCKDLDVDIVREDVSRCEWLYGKAFRNKSLRSPLVVEFTDEKKRIALFEAAKDEAKIKNELRMSVKPRKPRREGRDKVKGEDSPKEETEATSEENTAHMEPIFRKIYINPFISLPHSMLYTATREFTRRHRQFTCPPMSFYGRIKLQLNENKAKENTTENDAKENGGAAIIDDLTEKMKSLTLDGKTVHIKSPRDLWSLDRKFRSSALDKFYMYTDPYYNDSGYILEPYEWFSLQRPSDKRLTRRQLIYSTSQ